jgi:hypothetical protein
VNLRRSIPFLPLALLLLPLLGSLGVPQFQPRPARMKIQPPVGEPATLQGTTLAARPELDWRKSATLGPMVWLVRQQNQHGSWGDGPAFLEGQRIGRAGVSALVLLSIIGNGYSQLSADTYDGTHIGKAVGRAIQWLLQDQRDDGTFGSQEGSLDQALATLALSESYGMTAAPPFKPPAQKSLDALLRLQVRNGSWEKPGTTAWAVQALISGELGELTVPKEARHAALRYMAASTHPASLLDGLRLTPDRVPFAGQAKALAAAPPGVQNCGAWLHGSLGLFKYDGPDGPAWRKWSASMVQTLVSARDGERGWRGGSPTDTLVRTSLTLLTLLTKYRSGPSVFGSPP